LPRGRWIPERRGKEREGVRDVRRRKAAAS